MSTHGLPGSPGSQPFRAPARWTEIRAIVEAALTLPVEERADFLDRSCDVALREPVESLLAACEQVADPAVGFLAEPAGAFVAALLQHTAETRDELSDALQPTHRHATESCSGALDTLRSALAGRYDVERELGRGGTATVYLARDVRHGRRVAIKLLDPALGASLSGERFLREIRVTASLSHPHILPLYDSGEAAGLLYFVMPDIEGETLRERLAREGALPTGYALQLLREITDGLACAHDHGVVHRDIKPGNILLHGEHALVADFGIARAVRRARAATGPDPAWPSTQADHDGSHNTLTAAGVSPGTPAYMAPEQAIGGAVDERTDLYAVGVVAYEMLTGSHPFGDRATDALLEAHRSESPQPLETRAPHVPPALAALVMRLLAKDPAVRPASAKIVLQELARIQPGPSRLPVPRRGALLVSLLLPITLGIGAYVAAQRAGAMDVPRGVATDASSPSDSQGLAVLPFVNTGGDPDDEYFSDGLTDELAHALGLLPGVRLAGRTSSYAFKARHVPAPEIGRALGVAALVSGTVRRAGDRMRVTAQLVSTADGTVLWDSIFESHAGDVFALQDELARSIAAALAPALRGEADAIARAERGTSDPQAYEFYLRGHYHFLLRGADNVHRAIEYFRRAIQRDPNFARAHAGLVMAYRLLPVYLPVPMDSIVTLMDESARRAIALDSTLADVQLATAMTLVLQLRFDEALARHRSAVALNPASATAHLDYGFNLMNTGGTAEAIDEVNRALQLDPLVKSAASAVTLAYLSARRFPEAMAAARHAMSLDSTFPLAFHAVGLAQGFGGHPDSAVRALEQGARLHPGDSRLLAYLVFAYAAAGRWSDAQRVREQLHRPETRLIDGTEAARADLVFGDAEPLTRILTSTDGLRRYLLGGGFLGCNPLHDPLWADVRFRAAMGRLGVPPCRHAGPWPIPPPPADLGAPQRASGSGRSWKWSTLLVWPRPPSMWNGARVLTVAHRPLPFQPASGSSIRPSSHFV